MPDPLAPLLTQRGYVLLDGGLATELECRGLDLRDPLWSAKALLEAPELVRRGHLDYYRGGAAVGGAARHPATFPRLRRRGRAVDGDRRRRRAEGQRATPRPGSASAAGTRAASRMGRRWRSACGWSRDRSWWWRWD